MTIDTETQTDELSEEGTGKAPLTLLREASQAPVGWLNVVTHLDPRYGGLSAAVPELGSAVAKTKLFSVRLGAFCAPGESHTLSGHDLIDVSYWPTSRLTWLMDRNLRDRFRQEIEQTGGVHIHGLWEQSTVVSAQTARELRKPYILSAHGMLEPWALANRRFKKQVYAALFEQKNVNAACCLHALTGSEAADYRGFGSKAPIAVIPNGVHIPDALSPRLFLDTFPELRQKRLLLFLGRLHPKKGLDILVESWCNLAAEWPDAQLVLAGPDFESTRVPLEQKVRERGCDSQVSFVGMLSGEHKWSALAAAECFLLPSYSEGLSISVLEAMGVGLPVIISKQCNLPEVSSVEAGWVIESTVESLTYAMQEVLSNSPTSNQQIGSAGQKLVSQRYTWPRVAAQMSELYSWALGGPFPQQVDLRIH